eukprot:COSAG02_NODE_6863_length_3318_cov_9.683753_1_plen_402_part_00
MGNCLCCARCHGLETVAMVFENEHFQQVLVVDKTRFRTSYRRKGFVTLTVLAKDGETARVRRLLAGGADPNFVWADGCPAICGAAHQGHVNVVRLLMEAGASLEATTPTKLGDTGLTALMGAALGGHADCIEALLKGGPNLEAATNRGLTALLIATTFGHKSCVEALLAASATPLEPETKRKADFIGACFGGDVDTVRRLLQAGADPYAANDIWDGAPVLHIAAKSGHADCVEALLKGGANVGATDAEGWTALMCAAWDGHADCVEALLNVRGYDPLLNIHAKDDLGRTALFMAAIHGRTDCCRLLLRAGAGQGWDLTESSFYHYAEQNGHADVIALLRNPPTAEAAPPHQPALAEGVPSTPEPQPEGPTAEAQKRCNEQRKKLSKKPAEGVPLNQPDVNP